MNIEVIIAIVAENKLLRFIGDLQQERIFFYLATDPHRHTQTLLLFGLRPFELNKNEQDGMVSIFFLLTGSTGFIALVKYAPPQRNKSNQDFTGQAVLRNLTG